MASSVRCLVDRVTIEAADRALTVFPLANVSVFSFARAPDHLAVGSIWASVPHSVTELPYVFALVIGPDISAFAIAHVVLEVAGERALVVVVDDAALAVQATVFVPRALVRAAADLDDTLANELALAWHVVRRRRAISHRQQLAGLELVIGPDAFDFCDVSLFENHLALTVQLVVLDHAVVRDARGPHDLELAIHCLVLECTLVSRGPFLILSFVPGAVLEGALEPAFAAGLQVLDLALCHATRLEVAFIDRLSVREVQSALAMSLVHLVDLAVVSRAVAIRDVLDGQARKFINLGSFACEFGALLAGPGRTVRTRPRVQLLHLLCHL